MYLPALKPNVPTSSCGSTCSPMTAATLYPSNGFSARTSDAPPGTSSSPGWKSPNTVPSKSPSAFSRCSTPKSTAACMSCPQACMIPSLRERQATSAASWYGQCVDVGAQDDGAACVATALDAGQNAGAGNAAVLYAESRKLFGDEACGLLLLERQFGERMQVAAEFDRCHKSLFLFLVMVRGAYLPTMPLRADMYSGVVPQHPPTQSASPRSRYSDTTA